jgi:hypothetical protein
MEGERGIEGRVPFDQRQPRVKLDVGEERGAALKVCGEDPMSERDEARLRAHGADE